MSQLLPKAAAGQHVLAQPDPCPATLTALPWDPQSGTGGFCCGAAGRTLWGTLGVLPVSSSMGHSATRACPHGTACMALLQGTGQLAWPLGNDPGHPGIV